MSGHLRYWLHADRGSPAAEMGLVITLLLFLLGGALEFGLAIFQVEEANNAIEAGAAYAAAHPFLCCSSTYQTNIQTVVQNATGLGSNVSVSVTGIGGGTAPSCGCPNGASPPKITSTSCNAKCNNGLYAGSYVQVGGSYNMVSNILPWLPNMGQILPSTITPTIAVRIQ